jgi:hypothetical protein
MFGIRVIIDGFRVISFGNLLFFFSIRFFKIMSNTAYQMLNFVILYFYLQAMIPHCLIYQQ